jgi:hypothetical protein
MTALASPRNSYSDQQIVDGVYHSYTFYKALIAVLDVLYLRKQEPVPMILTADDDSLQPHFVLPSNRWSFDVFSNGKGASTRAKLYKKLGGVIYDQRASDDCLLLKPVVLDFWDRKPDPKLQVAFSSEIS